jgi:hypothetical protein
MVLFGLENLCMSGTAIGAMLAANVLMMVREKCIFYKGSPPPLVSGF